MDALVTVGGIPKPDDPLYPYSQGKSKALIDMAGKPMAQWVLDALSKADMVENVVIVGLEEDSGLACEKPTHFIPNQGGMIANIQTGTEKIVEINSDAKYVLIVSSDIPAITFEMVDWVVNACLETAHEVYYNVVERSVMESRFINSKRSYTKLKGIHVCGGDMNVVSTDTVLSQGGLFNRLAATRKNVLAQASMVGFDTLLLFALRMVNIEEAAAQITKKLDIPARGILCPYAEVAMDVDKPHQLELLISDLKKQPAS